MNNDTATISAPNATSTPDGQGRIDSHGRQQLKGLAGKLKAGSDRDRKILTGAKRLMQGGQNTARTRMAQGFSVPAEFAIAHDAGFRIFPPNTWPETATICQEARAIIAQLKPEQLQSKKGQLKQNLLDMGTLTLDSPHMKFALREDVLQAISSYLGVVPILADIDVWYSIHAGDTPVNSQLYHCDTNDVTQIKVFLYADAVDETSGPLTVIGAQSSQEIRSALNYTYEGKRKRVTDEQVEKLIGDRDQHPIVGPAGTCAFVDSSRCFHFGSRVKGGAPARLVTVFQYLTPTSFVFPVRFQEKAPLRFLDDRSLSTLQRMALGGA